MSRTLRPAETPVVGVDPDFEVPGFVEFYAGLRRPLHEAAPAELPALTGPLRGICQGRQWPQMTLADPVDHRVSTHGGWIVWSR